MTRDTVCQDDPPFAVGEVQIAPATDEEIAAWLHNVETYKSLNKLRGTFAHRLIARIKAEREQTIHECAEIAHTATMFTGCPLECMADEVRDAVLSLLQSKE